MERDITKKMINKLRENKENSKSKLPLPEGGKIAPKKNMLTEFRSILSKAQRQCLTEENKTNEKFVIKKNTPQFGDVRVSQEEALIKTIGENVELAEDALIYKPDIKDLMLSGKVSALGIFFQFRYNDPSGDGCYVWANGLQLTETNIRTVGKLRDAFLNWKSDLLQNGDLLEKLHKATTEE